MPRRCRPGRSDRRAAFLSAARQWLAAHGLTGTTIVEPTGISPRNTSTPSDLIAIGKLAAANPAIAQIAATPSLALPRPGRDVQHQRPARQRRDHGAQDRQSGRRARYSLLYTASLDVGAAQPLSVTGVMLGGYSRAAVDEVVLTLLRQHPQWLPLRAAGDRRPGSRHAFDTLGLDRPHGAGRRRVDLHVVGHPDHRDDGYVDAHDAMKTARSSGLSRGPPGRTP